MRVRRSVVWCGVCGEPAWRVRVRVRVRWCAPEGGRRLEEERRAEAEPAAELDGDARLPTGEAR